MSGLRVPKLLAFSARLRRYFSPNDRSRRLQRIIGTLLFCGLSVGLMGSNGCSCQPLASLVGSFSPPVRAVLQGLFTSGAGYHGNLAAGPHARFTGSDGSQTGIANFLGNYTALAESSGTYFTLARQQDCTLALLTGTSSLNGQFSVTSATPNYERTLHQLAQLTTTPDTYPKGCVDHTSGISTRVGVYAGITKSGIAVFATAQPGGSNQVINVLTTDSTLASPKFSTITSASGASALATADLNNDGNGDLVAVNAYNLSSAFVSILLGNADGSFQAPVSYPIAGNYSTAAVLGDVNGDGKLDLVAVSADQHLSVLLGNGDGTFQAAQSITLPAVAGATSATAEPVLSLITADVNGDGKLDVIGSNGLVLLGNGSGAFTAVSAPAFPFSSASPGGFGPQLAAGDINNDGKIDLAVDTGSSVAIYTGKGDGTFTSGASYAAINNSGYITLTDLDGDGNLDLYTGLADSGLFSGDDTTFASAYALMGRGDGTFSGAPTVPAGAYNGTNLADINGDGAPDLVAASTSNVNTAVLPFTVELNNGKGAFTATSTVPPAPAFTLNSYPFAANSPASATLSSYALGDVDGDGKADLVFVSSNLTATNPNSGLGITYPYSVYFTAHSNGDGTFAAPVAHAFPQIAAAPGFDNTLTVTNLQIADINKDGHNDLIATYQQTGSNGYARGFEVLTGNGNGTFSTTAILTSTYSGSTPPNTGNVPYVTNIVDVNNDGKLDLVVLYPSFSVANGTQVAVDVFLGHGDGTFAAPTTVASSTAIGGIPTLADFNKDGKLDIAFLAETAASQAELVVALGNGDGTFATPAVSNLQGGDAIRGASLSAADYNADGNVDLALFDVQDFSGVFYGTGTGTFTSVPVTGAIIPKDLVNIAAGGSSIAVDLNKDGKPDVMAGSTILLNSYGAAPVLTASTSTALTSSASSLTPGQSVTFTATVTPPSGSTATPTGTVTFYDGTASLGTGTLNASGVATFTTTGLATGPHSITATYGGDTNYSASTSTSVAVTVTAPAAVSTNTALTASSTSPVSGTSVTFTATVTQASGSAIPTGTVTFTDGATTLGTGTLNGSGVATYTTSSLAVGAHSIVATYGGVTGTFTGSASTALDVTVSAVVSPDFSVALSPTSATVVHGSPASSNLTITSIGGFSAAAALVCSGAPANSLCTIAPTSVTPTSTTPGSATVTLQTSVMTAALSPSHSEIVLAALPAGLLLLALTLQRRRRLAANLFGLALLTGLLSLTACGHSSSTPASTTATTAPGTYPLTITATSGALTHTATFTVTVQ